MLVNYSSLIPIGVLLTFFIGFKRSLIVSASFAALSTIILQQTLWADLYLRFNHELYLALLQSTGLLILKIGSIFLGAFFFLESSKKVHLLPSVAQTIQNWVSYSNVQILLIAFCFTSLVEGTIGFGAPVLIVTPLLYSLNLPIVLCVLLPLLNCVPSIPFGALGIPIIIGFGSSGVPLDPFLGPAVVKKMIPYIFLSPLITWFLVQKLNSKEKVTRIQTLKELLFCLTLSLAYLLAAWTTSHYGVDFPAMAGGLTSLVTGLAVSRVLFPNPHSRPKKIQFGLKVYFALLLLFALGKILKTPLLPPIVIFVFMGVLLQFVYGKKISPTIAWKALVKDTLIRSRNMVWVFSCLTLFVQMVRQNGALQATTQQIPFFLREGFSSLLGFLGTTVVGTSTINNLLLSDMVASPYHAAVAVGGALGIPVTFQMLAAASALFDGKVPERALAWAILPYSLFYLALSLIY